MNRYRELFRWTILLGATAGIVWLTASRNTLFGVGFLAGIAAGSHRTAYREHVSNAVSTAIATLSVAVVVAAVSITAVSLWWLPSLSTAALGYVIGVGAAWLLVSGASVDELGPYAAIGGLLIAVFGGAGGLLIVPDATLFVAMLFGGLAAGFVVPLSGLAAEALTTPSTRRSSDTDQLKPATRFGIEFAAIALVTVSVPFGSRAVALFGQGGAGWFPVGLLGGVILSISIWAVDGESTRLQQFHRWFVQRIYQLLDRLNRWAERRRKRGSRRSLDESTGEETGSETAAAGDGSLSTASRLVDRAGERLTDHKALEVVAEELDSLSVDNAGLTDRVNMFWSRLSGVVERQQITAGARLQLSAAEAAHHEGDSERARSMTDAALQLAAPTVGMVAAAVVRGRRSAFETVLDGLIPLFVRIDQLLAEEQLVDDIENPDQLGLIQRLVERLVEEETGEGFDSMLSTIRAAAADGWYSVQAGDQAVENGDYQRTLIAYLSAIKAYRRAYRLATDAKKTAAAERKAPETAGTVDQSSDGEHQLRAAAETYASEATRIQTALEALLYDTAAVTIAAIDDLYGEEPPPTVDTEYRRTIVRTLRVSRQTRTRIDATVPPIALADSRYQHAEIARSVARIRRHLAAADETAQRGNIQAAVEQYERAADRLDMLSNRASRAGLTDHARSLLSTANAISQLAGEPTVEAIRDRPDPSVPASEDKRAPEAVPAGQRLRRTFCEPAFVELWEFTDEAVDHSVVAFAGEPFPELVDAVRMALASLDPLYAEPDVRSLQEWVAETTLDLLSVAVETVGADYQQLCAMEPQPPPKFREQPAVLDNEPAASVPTGEGIEAFVEGWRSRADRLAAAGETITRRQAAVDGFGALEPKLRETLEKRGWLGPSQVSAELLEVAAYQLTGVSYDPERQRLSKTGDISRKNHESTASEAEPTADSSDADDTRSNVDADSSA